MTPSRRELMAGIAGKPEDPDTLRLMISRLCGLEESAERTIRASRGQARREARRHLKQFSAGRAELERELATLGGTRGYFYDVELGVERRRVTAKAVAIAESIARLSAGHRMSEGLKSSLTLLEATVGGDAARHLVEVAHADLATQVDLGDPSRALTVLLGEHGPEAPQPLVEAVRPASVPAVPRAEKQVARAGL